MTVDAGPMETVPAELNVQVNSSQSVHEIIHRLFARRPQNINEFRKLNKFSRYI